MKTLIVIIGMVLLCTGRADAIDLTTAGALSGAAQGFSNALSQWYAFEPQRQLMEEQARQARSREYEAASYQIEIDRLRDGYDRQLKEMWAKLMNVEYQYLTAEKRALDNERRLIDELDKPALDRERTAMGDELDVDKHKQALAAWGAKVQTHNKHVADYKQRLAEYEKRVGAYNQYIKNK